MFSAAKLQINRGTTTANTQGGDITTVLHTYKDLDLTVAAIILLLPPYLNQGATQDVIFSGDHILIEGSDTTSFNRIESLDPFTVSIDLFSGASGLSIGPTIAAVDNNAAIITGQILQMENADATHAGIVTTAAQAFGGTKTFTAIVAPGTNYTSAVPISATDTNAIIIDNSAKTIKLENADLTHPGIVTTAAQTFGGVKSFPDGIIAPGATYTAAVPGVATDANAIIINNTANTIELENADLTHPGIVTTAAQSFGGVKTFVGIVAPGTSYTISSPIAPTDANALIVDNVVNTLTLENADLTHPGIVSTAAQSFGGTKTFTAIVAPGANYATGAPVVASDANALIINNTTNVIQGQIADATHPGIITEVAQTFGGAKSFNGGVLTNAVDTISAVPLVLGTATATAITLSQNSTVSSGKTLNTNTLDATTAGTLAIGTTTATAITLAKSTTVTAGQLFKANSVDAATPGALSIGPTTATSIALAQNTAVAAAKIFTTDIIDATTAGALSIAPTTATAITLSQNTTVTAAKTFKADIIDATTAGALSIAPTTATSVTIAQNTTLSAAKTLKADIIDATTSGALTIAPTVATSVKVTPLVMLTSAGMQFSQTTSDVNQSIIKDYVEDTHSSTFTNNTQTTGTIVMTIRRVGKMVTVALPAGSVPTQAAPTNFVMNTVFVSKYRNINSIYQPIRIINVGGGAEVGLAVLASDGHLTIYAGMGLSFASGTTIGWSECAFTYPVA